MKKFIVFLLGIGFIISLYVCSLDNIMNDSVESITYHDMNFEIDIKNCTICNGTNTFYYTYDLKSNNYHIVITYPNGSTYSIQQIDNTTLGLRSYDYVDSAYVDGDTLAHIILTTLEKQPHIYFEHLWLSVVFIILGFLFLVFPKTMWFWDKGWQFNNAEPSDLSLMINRLLGVMLLIFSVLVLFFC